MDENSPNTHRLPPGTPPPRYRLPAATRPGAIRLRVGSLERSLSWYGEVLGLTPLERGAGSAALGAPGGATLVELVERPGAAPAPAGGRPGLYHFAILLPDRSALGRFVAHLARLEEPMGAADHLVSEALYLKDPDGLGVEVYADRPRSSWRYEGSQLVMATDPLDLRDLVRAGGGEPWRKAPADTVMGHLHLHVGDLEAAADFYHRGLGLDRVVWSYPGALFLSAGGYHHHLGLNTWARSTRPSGEDDAGLVEWELEVPTAGDVAAALASLAAAGHGVEEGGGSGVARDPWGTTLRIRPVGVPRPPLP